MAVKEVTFTMLVGISGSGKSTYANELMDKYKKEKAKAVLLSSDTIRKELYGDESIQENPSKVFQLMERRTLDMARKGFHVIYDATNLSSRRRKHMVQQMKRVGCITECVIVVADRDCCVERQLYRERKVPAKVIDKQLRSFEIPTEMEGWDSINFIVTDLIHIKTLNKQLKECQIPHNCRHHTLSIYGHMYKAEKILEKIELDKSIPTYYTLAKAVLFHDIGKPFTKSFLDTKGRIGTEAHYYGHENVSAWMILCSLEDFLNEQDCLRCAQLVGLHMRMYNEVWQKRFEDYFGKENPQFWEDLKILYKCDKEAH